MAVKMADLAAVTVDLLMAGSRVLCAYKVSADIENVAGDQVANVTVTRWPMV